MNLLPRSLLLPCLLASAWLPGAVHAQQAQALDLKLPQGSVYTQDPPGTWYGDTSGTPAAPASVAVARNACGTPLDEDDGKAKVHGSVSTGIGYSKGYGNSHWNAANVSLCKAYTTDEGNTGAFNLNIGVGQYDGPGFGPGYGRGYYNYRRAPGDVGPPPASGYGSARFR
ncbi:MAG TPA: hypothetical protein VM469_06610 [Pseudoxanthomonas sp.]|jgi:hypothetical protein|nr:hypothetical protein [Pseudoxanthomonas sp.]